VKRGAGFALIFFAASLSLASAFAESPYSIELDLREQRAYLIQGRHLILESPISSGRYGHLTERGDFKIIEKERSHFSTMYGKIVDARGDTIVPDADADMEVPAGGKFVPAPMRYFMRFNGATGMHAGYLPGYPASHGCVRLPEQLAIAFFNRVEVGTPVHVWGRTPRGRDYRSYHPQRTRQRPWLGGPFDPRSDPRYGPRFVNPWWR
jgi:L,D-transpeptidase catalytic domain